MICVSLGLADVDKCLKIIEDFELVEIRLDLTQFGLDDLQQLLPYKKKLLVSYQFNIKADETLAFELLLYSIHNQFYAIDIDSRFSENYQKKLLESAKINNVISILSYHNFDYTPTSVELHMVLKNMLVMECDIIKITCLAVTTDDVQSIEDLYRFPIKCQLIAFAMGEMGRQSRIDCLKFGAPFTYAAIDSNNLTAPGQLVYSELKSILED